MAWTIRQMDDFAGCPVWEWLSLVVFLASIRCSVWAIGVRVRALQGSRAALGNLLVATFEERLNHASRETTNANEWAILEDRVRSLGLGTVRRIFSPSLRSYAGE